MLELLSEHACFGGRQRFYRHPSACIGLPMRFSVFLPQQAFDRPVPALIYLAGLSCTEETFMIKAGAQRFAARHGLILVAPDTSPRGAGICGEQESWDLGVGAGFYLDATEEPWSRHYRMESYIVQELRALLCDALPLIPDRIGLSGHSMGGHGALTLALRNPGVFRSLSAFAPIASPVQSPWGQKAFTAYLGSDPRTWLEHDACELMRRSVNPFPDGILIDQGLNDIFLAQQLKPALFESACQAAGQPLTLRRHEGYDHGYYFVSTFIHDHIAFHAERLGG